MSARTKVIAPHLTLSAGVAAIFGAVAGSWMVFVVTFAILMAVDVHANEVRR